MKIDQFCYSLAHRFIGNPCTLQLPIYDFLKKDDKTSITKNLNDSRCAMRPRLTGKMQRIKSGGQIYYFFRINAFKFPGPDDVYFVCVVDIAKNASFPVGMIFELN